MSGIEKHYRFAPIIEAVIDIKVGFDQTPSQGDFDSLLSQFRNDYPSQEPINVFSMGITPQSESVQVRSESGFLGHRLTNEAKDRALQVRQDGFTYSHLPQYTNWGKFQKEAALLWDIYIQYLKPKTVTRCAVRYINKIEIQGQQMEPEDYFHIYPKIPSTLANKEVSNFNMLIQMPQNDLEASANIAQAIIQPSKPESIAILLDIDIFSQKERDISDTKGMWSYFKNLRDRKNELFEASITEKTREIIS